MHPGQQPPPQQPYHPGPAQPAGDNTQLGAGLMLVAAVCILIGIFSKSFVTASWDEGSESMKMGLMGAEVCDGDECRSMSWSQMGKVDGDVKAVRIIALISGFGAAGLCAVAGLMAFSRKRPPTGIIQAVMGVAAFSFTYFMFRWMAEGEGEVSPGPGFAGILGIGGLIVGSVVSKTMFKHLLPAGAATPSGYPASGYAPQPQPQPGHGYAPPPPPPAAATTACTRCGQPAQFVAQYQRWYCPSCQQYL